MGEVPDEAKKLENQRSQLVTQLAAYIKKIEMNRKYSDKTQSNLK